MGRRLGPSADEQRARLCARARASCQVEAARELHGKVTSDGGWASWSQEVTMECGEGKQKQGEDIVFVYVAVVQKQESDRELHSLFFTTHLPEPAFSHPF